jgi:hypothetical protein
MTSATRPEYWLQMPPPLHLDIVAFEIPADLRDLISPHRRSFEEL